MQHLRELPIAQLTPDARNANKGTKRGQEMIERSLRENGAGRSILIDANGKIIAGNKTAQNAEKAGIENVVIVQTDGRQLIAVQRMDLDLDKDPEAKRLALADNRTNQVDLDWDLDNLKALSADGVDLTSLWDGEELAKMGLIDPDGAAAAVTAELESNYKEQYGVIVICKTESEQKNIYDRLMAEGLECRVVVT